FFAAQAALAQRKAPQHTRFLFYTWENIYRERTYASRISFVYRSIEKRCYEAFHGAICATESAHQVLRRKGFTKPAAVIPYGIDSSFAATASIPKAEARAMLHLPDDFLVGYVGRLLSMKGIDVLMSAFSRFNQGLLLIVGTGEEERNLRSLIASLGIGDRVRLVGSVPHEQVPLYMRALDVLVLPSRTTPLWQEQLGRVLLEAMATETVVVGSSSGAIPEVIGDAGLVFQEDNVEQLSEMLTRLQEQSSLMDEMRVRGVRRVLDRFTWKRFAQDMAAFWESLR
ncbi:MAG TPA: glycosyltransferase, partial [bacterium]|nr:glycosyltransferase [bacterium]